MSDTLERRLREAMERRAGDVDAPAVLPPRVVKRAHRRQAGIAALAGCMVAAVVAASIIGTRTLLLSRGPDNRLGNANTTTQTVQGVSVTFPSNWHLQRIRGPVLFFVANFAPQTPFFSLRPKDVCLPHATSLAVTETSGLGAGSTPPWPVQLVPRGKGIPGCGLAEVATWRVGRRTFGAGAAFGNDVSVQDRATLHEVFASMEFGPAPSGAPPIPVASPQGTILARGTNAGTSWVLAADKNKGGVSLEVDLPSQGVGIGVPKGPGNQVPVLSPSSVPLRSGPGAESLVFGFVSSKVEAVRVEPGGAGARILNLPPGMRQGLKAFVVVTRISSRTNVVALDRKGHVLTSESVGPPTSTASPLTSPLPKASPSP